MSIFSAIKRFFEPAPAMQITITTTAPEPVQAPTRPREWEDLPSAEKIRRVVVKPLPFAQGDTLATESKAKIFTVRVTPQRPGTFEMDGAAALEIQVVARGREHALEAVAEKITGRGAHIGDSKATKADCGRWYDGDKCALLIVDAPKAKGPPA